METNSLPGATVYEVILNCCTNFKCAFVKIKP
jgi:hypothetical protein